MRFAIAALIALGGMLAAVPADACDCHDGGPVCQAFWTTPVIFVGRVVSISPPADRQRVRFTVYEALKGTSAKEIELTVGGTSCDLVFGAGETWLIYAFPGQNPGELRTGTCSRSRPLVDAHEDMLYAHATEKENRGLIIGRLLYAEQDRLKPVAGARVSAEDRSRRIVSAVTDADGRFSVKAGAAGQYRMRATVPRGMVLAFPETVTLLDPRACAVWDGYAEYNGSLTGVLTDSRGAPIGNVAVEAIPAARNWERMRERRGFTDARGRFDIGGLPPGDYLVAVAEAQRDESGEARPRLIYAGGDRRFRVNGGTQTGIGHFTLPATTRVTQITGVVVRPSGSPVSEVSVAIKADDDGYAFWWTTIKTDDQGRFSFGVMHGQRYRVAMIGADRLPSQRIVVDTSAPFESIRFVLK